MPRAFHALTAELWAIEPSWLHVMAALAQRDHNAPSLAGLEEWQARDYELLAGPGAQKLAGAQRAFAIDGVAVIPVMGPIFPRANMMTAMSGATSITMLMNDLRVALANEEIGAIVLQVDSPGGVVTGVAGFADAVAAATKKKPVVASVVGSASSAAYWIASAAGEIAIERTAYAGSIGVVAAYPKQVGPDERGMMAIEIVSSNAPKKRVDPETEEGASEIRATLDDLERHFISDVAKGRKVTADRVKADFGQGGTKVGATAVAAGMADRVQTYEATVNALRRDVANQRRKQLLRQ